MELRRTARNPRSEARNAKHEAGFVVGPPFGSTRLKPGGSVRLPALLIPLALLATDAAPKSGADLVRQMHQRYAGTWYRNLTFV
jgi:hypothetical protein